jgi:D-amino-acid dehydrogenase
MAKKAREHYFKIADDEKIEFNLLKKGLLHIYDNENELQAAREKKNWIEQDGMEWDYLDLDEIEDLEPAFKTDKNTKKIVGGIYTKSDASGDIHKFCVNLHKVLEDKYKLISKFNSEVETIYKEKDCVIISISDGNITEGLEFDKVAICAGVDTQKFANVLGDRMQVYPVKGYSVTINLNDQVSQEAAPKVSLIDDPVKIVSSRLGNRLRVAGTAELAGYNKDIRQDRVRPLLNWVKKYFPDVSTESYTPWAGLRPMTPDMMPLLFESNLGDIFYNTGHGHLGWTLSAETAEILAKKILNET